MEKANAFLVMRLDRGLNVTPHESAADFHGSFFTRLFEELLRGEKQMNVKTCASSDVALNWESIDWNKAKDYVKKLQMRIVKAVKEGRHNKVKSLQRSYFQRKRELHKAVLYRRLFVIRCLTDWKQ